MELPGLGEHCSEVTCRQLDFLPIKCDMCKSMFCSEHYSYAGHNCPNAYKKDVQVPICPLCSRPVPGKADELPDIRVSRHIDEECTSEKATSQRKRVYSNRCSFKPCKGKELVPITCDGCGANFCIRHRLPQDHECIPVQSLAKSKAGGAAIARLKSTANGLFQGSRGQPQPSQVSSQVRGNIQGNMSEDEAVARALQASLSDSSRGGGGVGGATAASFGALTQEQEDFMLAQALQESERDSRRTRTPSGGGQPRSRHQNCQIT